MKIMCFDTETTGLSSTKIINPDTLIEWPTIVQFSYVIYDLSLNEINKLKNYIIKIPSNIMISDDSIAFHGITNEISDKNGVTINIVLNEFFRDLRKVDCIIGHNIEFDINMIKVELLRIIYNQNDKLYKRLLNKRELKNYKLNLHFISNYKNINCTLKESITFCNIQAISKLGKQYLKYPKLIELHQKLFDNLPNNLHNSLNDILVTLRCFIKLKYDVDLLDKCNSFKLLADEISLFT
jgi:DNA polymerase III epsilon subunit-like protein